MTTGAWLMMGVSWFIIISLNVYCFSRVFRKKG
jgi:hypothetical protein